MTEKSQIELKVILLGPSAVGKTSFVSRYINKHYKEDPGTIGATFILKIWKSHKIAIWDTSGEEKYRSLSNYYCRGAGAVVMAFDLTKEHSFDMLEQEFVHLLNNTLESRVVAVVGMKADLVGQESEVFKERANNLLSILNNHSKTSTKTELNENARSPRIASKKSKISQSNHQTNSLYFETSSLLGTNVDEVFDALFTTVFDLRTQPSFDLLSSKVHLVQDTKEGKCSC